MVKGSQEFRTLPPNELLPSEANYVRLLNRLLLAFQAHTTESGRRRLPGGSFSAGIAMFPRHGTTLEQLLSRADRGLYAAKNHGRARIEVAPRTGFGTLT